ncbi:protein kinase domain-containing protein [Streptosporangium sp. LJ11]|uniref:serine/threonine-protein kinase n=1 Tax=Streptosporangium sp. LJ11 TaxID=3436927 RepID=UPI003F798543
MTAYGLPPVLGLDRGDPTELGPYRIAGRLGRGGMGTVYLAEGPSGPVAVKVINAHLAADREFVARFRNEVAAARKVSRFCTAPVLDARLEGEPLWVVTEYVAGPDLARVLRDHGPLSGSNLEALAVGVATALTAIHGAGIVHRDLKPANVLLSPLGPRVIDFGIARALAAEDGQTATGHILGTPEYMAPELVSGERAGPPADVFAWGCVVAAAATGRSPFSSRTVPEALYRVVHDVPRLDDVDPALRGVVEAALAKDPAARPTVRELLAGLVGRSDAEDTAKVAGTLRLNLSGLVPQAARTVVDPADGPGGAGPAVWRWRPVVIGAAAAGVLLLAAVAVVGSRLVSGGPPEITDVLYREGFSADTSGWSSGLTGLNTSYGYTGDGRYTMLTDGSSVDRWAGAVVNAEIPDRVLIGVKTEIVQGGRNGAWAGIYCEYSKDRNPENSFYYSLEFGPDGRARIGKAVAGRTWDLTADLPIPGFGKGPVTLRARCERGDGEVRVGLWAGDHLVAEVVDTEVKEATGRPGFGLHVQQRSDAEAATRAYFDDFEIGRLP